MENNEINPEYKWLMIDNVKYKTLLTKKYMAREKYKEVNEKFIYAFISGTINKVEVKAGKKVKAGDQLLILEAMKMNNIITSPVEGVIKKVKVKKGDHVAKNQLLIEFA